MRKKGGYNHLTLGSMTSGNSTYMLNTYFDTPGLTTDKIIRWWRCRRRVTIIC